MFAISSINSAKCFRVNFEHGTTRNRRSVPMKTRAAGIFTIRRDRRATLRCFAGLAFTLLILTSCKAQPKPNVHTPPPVAPSFSSLAAAHNDRVHRLEQIYAIGVIEIRWVDRKGKHFEQGNMELWIHQPRRTALRVDKLGEPLLWLGSNDTHYWLFDLLNDERVLHLGSHDTALSASGGGTGLMIDIKPLALLDLVGITPIDTSQQLPVAFSSQHNAWLISTQGKGGPLRIYFDRQSLLPSRIEMVEPLDSGEEKVIAHSTLQRYKAAPIANVSPLAFPKLAHQVDIIVPAVEGQAGGGEVKIVMDHSTTVIDSSQLQRVFDLERLKQALRPGRIEQM